MATALAERIDALLPQTQCTRCGYPACLPYAEAIADGAADINRCPPGGEQGVHALAALLGRAVKALDPECGEIARAPVVAFIDEAVCIGCTKCLPPCPVDAIVGAPKRMHTVIAALCTGCELCIAPCPVDCISLVPAPAGHVDDDTAVGRNRRMADDSRRRHASHVLRRERDEREGHEAHRAQVARAEAVAAASSAAAVATVDATATATGLAAPDDDDPLARVLRRVRSGSPP